MLDLFPLQEDWLNNTMSTLLKLNNKDSKRNHTSALRTVKICFLQRFITFLFLEILVVRSGPEGPQLARSVSTLPLNAMPHNIMHHNATPYDAMPLNATPHVFFCTLLDFSKLKLFFFYYC